MTIKNIKFQKRTLIFCSFIICGIIFFISLLLVLIFFVLFYDSWIGDTKIGATIQFQRAMDCNDGKSAVFYARKLVNHYTNHEGKITYPFVLNQLALAYELNKDYEQALGVYQSCPENDKEYDAVSVARIYYKQKKYTESFQKYCSATLNSKYQGKTGRIVLRNDIMCRHLGKAKKFMCPFENDEQFTMFINNEYEKLGCPKKDASLIEKYNEH